MKYTKRYRLIRLGPIWVSEQVTQALGPVRFVAPHGVNALCRKIEYIDKEAAIAASDKWLMSNNERPDGF